MSLTSQYNALVSTVSEFGGLVSSRHGDTLELLNVSFTASTNEFLHRRGMSDKLGWMEALQIVGGIFAPEDLKKVAPKAQHKLFTEQMAYGPRIADQMAPVIDYLRRDPRGRQATVWVAKPEDGCSDAQTCTTSMHFYRREEALYLTVNMRSWDLVKGLPYDLMFFQLIKACVARALWVRSGHLHVNAGSGHIYVADLGKAYAERNQAFDFHLGVPNGEPPDYWADIRDWARGEVATFSATGSWPHGLHITRWGELKEEGEIA